MFDEATLKVFEKLESTQKDFWNVPREAANFLNMLLKMSSSKNALEIGTSNGYSGIWLAKALKENGGRLTTIEFWDNRLELARANFKECGVDDLISTKLGSAFEILQNLEDEYDFIFIDANKSEYVKYFELVHPKLKKGGIIAADNVTSHAKKVQPFMANIQNRDDYQTQMMNFDGGLLLAYKLK